MPHQVVRWTTSVKNTLFFDVRIGVFLSKSGTPEQWGNEIKTYEKQKNRCELCLFLSRNNVDLKNNNIIIENHSQVSGWGYRCNKFVLSRPWSPMILPVTLLRKGTFTPTPTPLAPFQGAWEQCPCSPCTKLHLRVFQQMRCDNMKNDSVHSAHKL